MSDGYRIPLEDLRAWHRVWPKQQRRGLDRSLRNLEAWFRVDRLTMNPHAECDHRRAICMAAATNGGAR